MWNGEIFVHFGFIILVSYNFDYLFVVYLFVDLSICIYCVYLFFLFYCCVPFNLHIKRCCFFV